MCPGDAAWRVQPKGALAAAVRRRNSAQSASERVVVGPRGREAAGAECRAIAAVHGPRGVRGCGPRAWGWALGAGGGRMRLWSWRGGGSAVGRPGAPESLADCLLAVPHTPMLPMKCIACQRAGPGCGLGRWRSCPRRPYAHDADVAPPPPGLKKGRALFVRPRSRARAIAWLPLPQRRASVCRARRGPMQGGFSDD